MSAGRDAWTALCGMVRSAVAPRAPDEQAERLAQLGAEWWALVAELAKRDAVAAAELVRAQWHHAAAFRPDPDGTLGDGFGPTEAPPSSPRGLAA